MRRKFGFPIHSTYYPVGSDCVLYHAYWDGTAKDHSGKGNNGTLSGGTFVDNWGLTFGAGDTELVINSGLGYPDPSLYPGTGDFSFFVWIKVPSWAVGMYFKILSWIEYGSASEGTMSALGWGTKENYNSQTIYSLSPSSYWYTFAGYGIDPPLPENQWFLYTYCIDRDVGGYYSVNNVTPIGPRGNTNTGYNIKFDRNYNIGSTIYGNSFIGTIGEVLQFNSFKSPSDITTFFNATKARYGL